MPKLPFDKDSDLYVLRLAIATAIYAMGRGAAAVNVPSSIDSAIKAADELMAKCAENLPQD